MRYYLLFSYWPLFLISIFLQRCKPANTTASGTAARETAYYSIDDFTTVLKYDTHVHLNVDDTTFIHQAKVDNFRLLTVNVTPAYYPPIQEQRSIAMRLIKAYPNQVAYSINGIK